MVIEHWPDISKTETADLEAIRAGYAGKTELFSDMVGDIRFRR